MSKRPEWKPLLDYSWLDELIEEAEIYCITHEIEVECDYEIGQWSIIDPIGCWTIAPSSWPKERAIQCASIFAFLWFKGCSPPIAEELAHSYVRLLMELEKRDTECSQSGS